MQQSVREEPPRPVEASAPARTRIVLIEDHGILRAGLRTLLDMEADLQVVGEAGTANDGVRVVRETAATLVITDLALPGGSGLSTIDTLRSTAPNLRVLILTAYCTDEYLSAAFGAGADGYLLKDASRAELLQAIRAVMAGRRYFSSPVSARLLTGYLARHTAPATAPSRLTAREREVLTRIALGDSNKRAALAMRLSIKTVEKHRANLMRKLELHNAAGMTLFAVRNGLLPSGPTEGERKIPWVTARQDVGR
jgi:DNA-binding NarL/FixJ family response regulator